MSTSVNGHRGDLPTRFDWSMVSVITISISLAILIIQAGFEDAAWAWKLISTHLPI